MGMEEEADPLTSYVRFFFSVTRNMYWGQPANRVGLNCGPRRMKPISQSEQSQSPKTCLLFKALFERVDHSSLDGASPSQI